MQTRSRNLFIAAMVAVLVAITCWNQLPGQAPAAKPAAVKWEYKIIISPALDQNADKLNEVGAEGWELTVVYPYGTDGMNLASILRRPKAGK